MLHSVIYVLQDVEARQEIIIHPPNENIVTGFHMYIGILMKDVIPADKQLCFLLSLNIWLAVSSVK